jgi:hypothetical protein
MKRTITAALGLLLVAGCASSPTGDIAAVTAPPTSASFAPLLQYPDRLQPLGDTGALSWRDAALDVRKFDAILVERIRVKLANESAPIDPAEIKSLTDYFHQALVKAVQPAYRAVERAGPGVLRVRITLVDLVGTNTAMSVVVLATPYATIPDLVSGAAGGEGVGSAPYLGRTGITAQFIDGATNRVVAEYVDVQFGRKYVLDTNKGVGAAITSGAQDYLNAYSKWAYAKQAFDGWAAQLRARLDALRG